MRDQTKVHYNFLHNWPHLNIVSSWNISTKESIDTTISLYHYNLTRIWEKNTISYELMIIAKGMEFFDFMIDDYIENITNQILNYHYIFFYFSSWNYQFFFWFSFSDFSKYWWIGWSDHREFFVNRFES